MNRIKTTLSIYTLYAVTTIYSSLFIVECIMIPARNKFCKTACFVWLALLVFVFVRFGGEFNWRSGLAKADVKPRVESWKDMFIDQLHPDHLDCRELFATPEADEDFYTKSFLELRRKFNEKARQEYAKAKPKAGHAGLVRGQIRFYYWLARRPWVKTICEIGFNAGHSTLQWLAASDDVVVHSFDIAIYTYVLPMAAYINQTFPGRFHLYVGDSTETVPRFSKTHSDVRCDVVVVDGAHKHKIALADVRNMRAMANRNHNVLIFDDYPSTSGHFMSQLGPAWNTIRAEGHVVDRFSCATNPKRFHSFVVGYYLFHQSV